MTKSLKSFVINFLKTAVGLALLAYVIYINWEPKNGGPGIKGLLNQTPDYSLLACVFLLTGVTLACQTFRWYLLVKALDLPFTIRNAFRLSMVGYYFNTLLPGSVGGDFLKAVFIAKEQPGRMATAVSTVFVDRFLGLFGLLLYAAVIGGTLWLTGDPKVANNDYLRNIVLVSSILVAATAAGWVVLGFLSPARTTRIGQGLVKLKGVGKTLAELWEAAVLYRRRPKLLYLTFPITAFAQFLMILNFHLAVQIFPNGGIASFGEHFVICPIGYIGQALFPAPGGVGGAEAIFGYLYQIIDRPEQTAVVGRLTMRVAEYSLAAMGFAVYLSMRAELPVKEEPSEAKVAMA